MVSLRLYWSNTLAEMPKTKGGLSVKSRKRTRSVTPVMVKVILLNDDYTPMNFVVDVLVSIFNKSRAEAFALMWKVHTEGMAVCGEYPKEIAETKAHQVIQRARMRGYPLQAIVE